jgi:hypothetical protein
MPWLGAGFSRYHKEETTDTVLKINKQKEKN